MHLLDFWWLIPLALGAIGGAHWLGQLAGKRQQNAAQQSYADAAKKIQQEADDAIAKARAQIKAESDQALAEHASKLIAQGGTPQDPSK